MSPSDLSINVTPAFYKRNHCTGRNGSRQRQAGCQTDERGAAKTMDGFLGKFTVSKYRDTGEGQGTTQPDSLIDLWNQRRIILVCFRAVNKLPQSFRRWHAEPNMTYAAQYFSVIHGFRIISWGIRPYDSDNQEKLWERAPLLVWVMVLAFHLIALAVCRLETDLLWWQDHHSLIINQILQSRSGATPNPPLALRSVCCCWELVWHESMRAQLLYLHLLALFTSTCQTTTRSVVGNTNTQVVTLTVKAAKYVSVKVSRAPAWIFDFRWLAVFRPPFNFHSN